MQSVVQLNLGLKRIETATYSEEMNGIVFKKVVIFERTIEVPTDKLLVSKEAVSVLDKRE